jgi:hypothetical protein
MQLLAIDTELLDCVTGGAAQQGLGAALLRATAPSRRHYNGHAGPVTGWNQILDTRGGAQYATKGSFTSLAFGD